MSNVAIQDDIKAIVSGLGPDDRAYILNLAAEDLIRLHRTLGLNLRNAFRSGEYPNLFRYCYDRETDETRSFDSMSQTAISLIWDYLRRERSTT